MIDRVIAVTLLLAPFPALAAIERVISVHDGDTFTIARRVRPWNLAISVRLLGGDSGIDTPEIGSRARCEAEAEAAEDARLYLRALIAVAGQRVTLQAVSHDKYGGRILARAVATIGIHRRDLGLAMIEAGHAVPYSGEGPRHDWCAPQPANLLPPGF